MKYLLVPKWIYFFVVLILIFTHFSRSVFASSSIYQDNFDNETNGTFPNGWVQGPTNCPPTIQWQVINGSAGLTINDLQCISTIYPDDLHWGNLGNNYILEADMTFVNGTDHNIAFRYDTNTNGYNEIHFQSPGDISLNIPLDHYNVFVPGNYPNGATYHIKVIINGLSLKIYIDNTLVRDAVLSQELPNGRIALRVGTGNNPSTATYFDNIVVTSIDNVNLNVPVFKQADIPWNTNIYDGADNWFPLDPTISRWGCALSSAAMILKYHGYNLLPDGTPLNPGTLNTWLKNFKKGNIGLGYVNGVDTGYINWMAISQLSKLAKSKNGITDKDALQLNILSPDSTQLKLDLVNNIPDILQVRPATGMHYVVAKGTNGNTFTINDPGFNIADLNGYGNNFWQLVQYKPSFTDLSYIVIAVDPTVSLNLSDGTNNNLGTQFIQDPYSDPTGLPIEPGQKSLKLLYLPIPLSGNYNLGISGNSTYKLTEYLYDKNGNANALEQTGIVSTGSVDMIKVSFDNQNSSNSSSAKVITFQTIIDDVNDGVNLDIIKPSGPLLSALSSAQKYFLAKDSSSANDKLDLFIKHLNTQRGKGLTETAYQILLFDANYLKAHLD